jgi:hypothetical protein
MPAATAKRLREIALERGLSPKYLVALWNTLTATNSSLLLDPIRVRWRAAKPGDAPALAKEIAQWQHSLWKFNSVGHIGKTGGPKAWMEPISPLQPKQEVRLKIPVSADAEEITLYLSAADAGDSNEGDNVVWEQPRLVAPGRPNLLLRDVRNVSRELGGRRERIFRSTARCLSAAAEASVAPGRVDMAELARKHNVEADALAAWLDYLGIGSGGPVKIEGYFTDTFKNGSGYAFIRAGAKRNAEPCRQFFGPACPNPRQHEAAQCRGASVAEVRVSSAGAVPSPAMFASKQRFSTRIPSAATASPGRWNYGAARLGNVSQTVLRKAARRRNPRPSRISLFTRAISFRCSSGRGTGITPAI